MESERKNSSKSHRKKNPIINEILEAKMGEKEYQVDSPEWVEYLRRFNENDTVYPRAFIHALLNDPESPLYRNRRAPEAEVSEKIFDPVAHLGNKLRALRAGIEQVRDEANALADDAYNKREWRRFGGLSIVINALTALLNEDKETKDFDPLGYMCPVCGKKSRTKWSDPSDEDVCKCE